MTTSYHAAIAASDEKALLTDGKAAVIGLIVEQVPPGYRPVVSAFVGTAANKATGPLNAAVDAGVAAGIAHAHAALVSIGDTLHHRIG